MYQGIHRSNVYIPGVWTGKWRIWWDFCCQNYSKGLLLTWPRNVQATSDSILRRGTIDLSSTWYIQYWLLREDERSKRNYSIDWDSVILLAALWTSIGTTISKQKTPTSNRCHNGSRQVRCRKDILSFPTSEQYRLEEILRPTDRDDELVQGK